MEDQWQCIPVASVEKWSVKIVLIYQTVSAINVKMDKKPPNKKPFFYVVLVNTIDSSP